MVIMALVGQDLYEQLGLLDNSRSIILLRWTYASLLRKNLYCLLAAIIQDPRDTLHEKRESWAQTIWK